MEVMITIRVFPVLLVWRRFGDVRWRVMTRTGWQHLVRLADEFSHSLKVFKHSLIRICQPVFSYWRKMIISPYRIRVERIGQHRRRTERFLFGCPYLPPALPLIFRITHVEVIPLPSEVYLLGQMAQEQDSLEIFFMKTCIFAYYFLVNTFRSNEN